MSLFRASCSAALAVLLAASAAGAAPTWVRANRGLVPAGAFVASEGPGRTVLCRANFRGSVHPGKVVGTKCFITHRGGEVGLPDFEVLLGIERSTWVTASGAVPPGAWVGGQDGANGVYVCRAVVDGMVLPGKVLGNQCSVSIRGREQLVPTFDVLVLNAPPPATTNAPIAVGGSVQVSTGAGTITVTGTGPQPGYPAAPPAYPAQGGYPAPPPGYPSQPAYPAQQTYAPQWVDVTAGLPAGAFAAGTENGQPLLLCRASHEGGWHPGKVVGGQCNFGYGGQELGTPRFQVLLNVVPTQTQWVAGSDAGLPTGVFVAGVEQGRALVLCRGSFNGGTHPGKLVGRSCNITWGGREMQLARYDLLLTAPIAGDVVAGATLPTGGGRGNWGGGGQPAWQPPAPKWVDAANGLNPQGAFSAGTENGVAQVLCRAASGSGWFPGRVAGNACRFASEGQELQAAQYQVLTNLAQATWTAAQADQPAPQSAFVGGFSNNRPHPVCRATFNTGTYPGRLSRRGCSIGLGGQEVVVPSFEVLVAPAITDDPALAAMPRDAMNGWGAQTAMATPAAAAQPAMAAPARWIDTEGGTNPAGAFAAGDESGRPLVLCRAQHAGGLQPGKVVNTGCNFAWNGSEMIAPRYQVLANVANAQWIAGADGTMPAGAFVAGNESGRQLVVCRGAVNGGTHPGKLVGRTCNVGWGGRELQLGRYEVLVATPVP